MAMVLVITVLAALLGIGAISLSLQLNSTKSATLVKDSRSSLYCAEAGIAAARNELTANRSAWDALLADPTGADFPFYPIQGDIDGDGTADFTVTIKDDGDDLDFTTDVNGTIIVTSVCDKFDNAPATIIEVIRIAAQGHTYRNQSGQGSGNTGNAN